MNFTEKLTMQMLHDLCRSMYAAARVLHPYRWTLHNRFSIKQQWFNRHTCSTSMKNEFC